MAVFDPNRKRNARGEQRYRDLILAASRVFARTGYHDTTTNAIAAEAGVSPATLYQFFPNKEAIASELTAIYAREMAASEQALDPERKLPFADAVRALLDICIDFNRDHPEFHTLVLNAPLSDRARQEKVVLGEVFVHFIADRLRLANPALTRSEASHHGNVALLIFRGILDALVDAPRSSRRRLQQAMHTAVVAYLQQAIQPANLDAAKPAALSRKP